MRNFQHRIRKLERAAGIGLVFPSIILALVDPDDVRREQEWYEAGGHGERPEVRPLRGPNGGYVDPDTMQEVDASLVDSHTLIIFQEGPTAEILNMDNVVVDGLPASEGQV